MQAITPATNRRLHMLLTKAQLIGRKHAIVYDFTNGRTESSRELLEVEARRICQHLEKHQPAPQPAVVDEHRTKMLRKVYAIAHQVGYTHAPVNGAKPKLNYQQIDAWCAKYGHHHKALLQHSNDELPSLITQMEKMFVSQLSSYRK